MARYTPERTSQRVNMPPHYPPPGPPYGPPPGSHPHAPSVVSMPGGGLQIGGPQGIQIHGSNVQVGGWPVGHAGPSGHAVQTPHASRPLPSIPARTEKSATSKIDAELYRDATTLPRLFFLGAMVMCALGVILWSPLVSAPALFYGFCFGSAGAGAGFSALLSARSKRLHQQGVLPPHLEQGLLELAHRSEGRLTVPDTARELQISLSEAEKALTRLAQRGYAELDVGPNGELSFRLGQASAPAVPPALPRSGGY